MLLILDNFDSFTYNLADYFMQCGVEVEVIRNDALDLSTVIEKYSGVVISPGPNTPSEAGCTMDLIKLVAGKLPVYGVCLGMQAIGEYAGAELIQANYPMHGKVSELSFDNTHPMFQNIEQPLKVCRYHSLILERIESTDFQIIAKSEHNEAMAVAHNTLPLWGVQFHPEAILTTQGLQLIKNWIAHYDLK